MKNDVTLDELRRLREMERKQKERYKTQNERTNKLYDRISFTVPKGQKQVIEMAASRYGMSVNKFISEMLLKIVVNNNILEMIFNNNIIQTEIPASASDWPQEEPDLAWNSERRPLDDADLPFPEYPNG